MTNSELTLLIYIFGFLIVGAIFAWLADEMIDFLVRMLTGR